MKTTYYLLVSTVLEIVTLVNQLLMRILLIKLKHLGFGDDAIDLIKNYFAERTQMVKYENSKSSILPINLSVPQGSVLGPLFFLLFINDLPFFLKSVTCKMFADDTTIYKSMNDLLELISFFRLVIKDLITWCNFNRVDINWSKTFIMFITNKRVEIPKEITFDENTIQVVECFKLLGIKIDHKLNFMKYVGDLRKSINKRIFSIKRLFYLPAAVKLQFLKTFILPYFDYCSTIYIYFSKSAIQKLFNSYNWCIWKLLGITSRISTTLDYNTLNNRLSNYGLASLQHKLISIKILHTHDFQ